METSVTRQIGEWEIEDRAWLLRKNAGQLESSLGIDGLGEIAQASCLSRNDRRIGIVMVDHIEDAILP